MSYINWTVSLGRQRFGFSHDMVLEGSDRYLERWVLWCGASLRLHKFHKGDDDRASHDHPWWFLSLPLRSYLELTPGCPSKKIKAYRLHFRGSGHRHIVKLLSADPVWTVILTGRKKREWGFWNGEKFTQAEDWLHRNTGLKTD